MITIYSDDTGILEKLIIKKDNPLDEIVENAETILRYPELGNKYIAKGFFAWGGISKHNDPDYVHRTLCLIRDNRMFIDCAHSLFCSSCAHRNHKIVSWFFDTVENTEAIFKTYEIDYRKTELEDNTVFFAVSISDLNKLCK